MLYAGTELGVFVSFDDGAHWQPLQLNLPVSPIHDLVVKDDDLVVGTHGRSFWVLDNLTPLRQAIAQMAKSDFVLYQPQTALLLNYPTEFDKRQPVGENPPPGAMIDYYFKSAPKDEVTLDILDSQGKLVRHLSSKEKKKEEQPPEWPDRVEAPKTIPAAEGNESVRVGPALRRSGANAGCILCRGRAARTEGVPGDYQVKMTVAGKTQTAPLKIVMDPRIKNADAGAQKQFELGMQVRDRISQLHSAINEIRDVKAQIKTLHAKFSDDPKAKPALKAADD